MFSQIKNESNWRAELLLSWVVKETTEMLRVYQLDILFLLETDTTMIMEEKDYKLKGFNTIFHLKKNGNEKTRIVAICK